MYNITKINKVTFIFSPFKGIETASLGVFLGIGSRFEKKREKGIAHYLEHMVFKGSRKYSYRKIKREIEGRGGALNAFTSQELTGYYAYFLNKNLNPTLDILLDMVMNPLLDSNEIEKERNVILEEIKMYNDLPSARVTMSLDQLLWQTHPLGDEVIGYEGTVKRIKKCDLTSFQKEFYLPSNMVVSCTGDLDEKKVIDLIGQKVEKISDRARFRRNIPASLRGFHINVEKKELAQAHLCLGFRGVSYLSQERYVADLINVILGANMSSRLFEEVRERRALCYDISTEVRKYRDSGAFAVHLGLDKSKITVALSSILKELTKLKEKLVSLKEVDRAKDYLLGQMAMGLERPGGRMFFLAESYLSTRRIYTLNEIKKKIRAIDAYQIRELSREIFSVKNMCVACIGDFNNDIEKKIKDVIK
ncbi:MAG: pitrilysin family protein [Candidatus Omnitrophota bacterium]|nr:insulinase family protein [Candidatus Omnitrophota bacterium]